MSIINEIKAHIEAGKDINQFHGEKTALFCFLDSYYQLDINDDEELQLPLAQRKGNVCNHLKWLFVHGADINGGNDWKPLMLAVGNLDVAMTEYLLNRGADPHYDLPNEGIPYGCGNYYIDNLDIAALDESFEAHPDKAVFDRILRIAVLLARHGVSDVHTHCISIDSLTRTVRVSQTKAMY